MVGGVLHGQLVQGWWSSAQPTSPWVGGVLHSQLVHGLVDLCCVSFKNIYCSVTYCARQKSWPVIHNLNEKSYKQVKKCLLLVDMHRGYNSAGICSLPLPEKNDFLNPGGHADFSKPP